MNIDPNKLSIGIFLYPNMTMLDAYGPLQVLAVSRQFNVFTFAKHAKPLPSDAHVDLLPHYGFADCPNIDVLIVPGSANPIEQIKDVEVISRLREIGDKAKYVTSVCTGSLILAETGLLDGYQTAVHWAYADALKKYPKVTHVNQRVVKDRNRISGGGVTSGLDFAFTLVAEFAGKGRAQALELLLEYDPQPPFNTGNHNTTPKALKAAVQSKVYEIGKGLF
ncbi:thiamine biosynthesis protein ThiJ [Veronia pacifica]|uniref:Thiamine biosynthesis protein ThiJ n=1 Tax=Veronia pacifica TaxID=1080227 RepID=A0A1C3EBP5_9GAMM|nr:thiamine biosynthesis protein ThiJ [Veronia pacifica]